MDKDAKRIQTAIRRTEQYIQDDEPLPSGLALTLWKLVLQAPLEELKAIREKYHNPIDR